MFFVGLEFFFFFITFPQDTRLRGKEGSEQSFAHEMTNLKDG